MNVVCYEGYHFLLEIYSHLTLCWSTYSLFADSFVCVPMYVMCMYVEHELVWLCVLPLSFVLSLWDKVSPWIWNSSICQFGWPTWFSIYLPLPPGFNFSHVTQRFFIWILGLQTPAPILAWQAVCRLGLLPSTIVRICLWSHDGSQLLYSFFLVLDCSAMSLCCQLRKNKGDFSVSKMLNTVSYLQMSGFHRNIMKFLGRVPL